MFCPGGFCPRGVLVGGFCPGGFCLSRFCPRIIMIMQGDYTESKSYTREYVAMYLLIFEIVGVTALNILGQCQILDEILYSS